MQRKLEAEWLDALSPSDEEAQRSRRDLKRVNRLMGHSRHVRDAIRASGVFQKNRLQVVDLGTGDGSFALTVVRALGRTPGSAQITLVDQHPCIEEETRKSFSQLGWETLVVESNIFSSPPEQRGADLVLANLFLHHFSREQLNSLFLQLEKSSSCIVACEPRRSRFSLLGAHLLGLIGCNAVTRHDAVASVWAGFQGSEISQLWPETTARWDLQERSAGLFSHLFVARRR